MAIWEVGVSELVVEFSTALRALVPQLDAARVEWRASERYDDFDRIAEALYASMVLSPAIHDQRFRDLGLGDFRPFGFSGVGWPAQVAAFGPDGREALPLVDLDSVDQPFDTAVLDQRGRVVVPLVGTEFVVARGGADDVAILRVHQ